MNTPRPRGVILCVNDEEELLRLRKQVLERVGYSVLTTTSGAEALAILRGTHVDLVLTDHLLPSSSGTALAVEMKQIKPEVPVAILSGLMDAPENMQSADLFISKLTPLPELLETIEKLIASPQ